MPLHLNQVPGFADLPDAVLTADEIAYAIHLGRIAQNAAFGMVRLEIFTGLYKHGDTVPLPTSRVDKSNYRRDELIYFWTVRDSGSTTTNWISGPGSLSNSLWFTNWNVQQYNPTQSATSDFNKNAGLVFSEEWYRRSGENLQSQSSNDGTLLVFTIAQRLLTQLVLAAPPTYAAIDEATIGTNKADKEALLQALNRNAKLSIVNSEVFWMGEFTNGQTVPTPISRADGKPYSYAEIRFMHAWRWTAAANNYRQPPESQGQLGPFIGAVNASGVVFCQVQFVDDDGHLEVFSDFGRLSVFAFCTRAETPATAPLANDFTELDNAFFAPGHSERASTVLAIKKNIDEALLTPEFFGPTIYHNGDTVPLPVSDVDDYPYSRAEMINVWSWADTTNHQGQSRRLPVFFGNIDDATGLIRLHVYRLPPGGPYVDDDDSLCRVRVLTVGFRQSQNPELVAHVDSDPPADAIIPPPPDALFGAASDLTVDITAPSGAEDGFTIAHGFGSQPEFVKLEMTSGGNIWLDGSAYDATNLYLKGSAAGVTGKALLFGTAPAAEITATPLADGNFLVPHSLGATPKMVLVQMRSGGNIWSQPAVADSSFVYLTASEATTAAHIGLWLALNGDATPSVNRLQIPLSAAADGEFQVPHNLGVVPKDVFIHMKSPGFPAFWFQATRYDDVNIYLVSPGAGVSGFAEVLY